MSQNTEESLIIASRRDLPTFTFNKTAIDLKAKALEQSALIGAVKDRDTKIIAVRAQVELKRVLNMIEKARKELKEPLLNAGRQLDNTCAKETKELQQEYERVSSSVAEFDEQERIRIAEEERKQREELEKIERAKQEELARIEREKQEAERKAREAAAEAERLAKAAKTAQEQEEARKRAAEAQELQKQAAQTASQSDKAAAAVEEKAADDAFVAGRPIHTERVAGQRSSVDYEITKINEWVLAKARPDLVSKITFDMRAIKEELKRGVKIPGVEAREVLKAGVRVSPERPTIDV